MIPTSPLDANKREGTLSQLPVQQGSSAITMTASASTEDILEKIRESVEHEGHGDSHVFVILGASVSLI